MWNLGLALWCVGLLHGKNGWVSGYTLVISASWEAAVEGSQVQASPGHLNDTLTQGLKRAEALAQYEGPEFSPQYH